MTEVSTLPPIETMSPAEIEAQITAGLDAFEASIQAAPGNVVQPTEPGGFPRVPNLRLDRQTIATMRTGDYSSATFSRYVGLALQAEQTTNQLYGSTETASYVLSGLAHDFTPELVQKMFDAEGEEGIMHQTVLEKLHLANEGDAAPRNEVDFLRQVYGAERPTDLLRPSEDPFRAKIRDELLSPRASSFFFFEEVSSKRPRGENREPDADKAELRVWMRDVVMRATDIADPELADRYVYAASRGVSNIDLVGGIIKKMDTLGPEGLARIAKFANIYTLQDCTIDQLQRMDRLAQRDPEEIARLQSHDTILTITNRLGEQGGDANVLSTIPEIVDDASDAKDPARRSIICEVESLEEGLAFVGRLHSIGIDPSTVVFATHTSPGEFVVKPKPPIASERSLGQFIMVHSAAAVGIVNQRGRSQGAPRHYSLDTLAGVTQRLARDYMQPSRGIDDPDVGKKKIVFIACNADTAVPTVQHINVQSGTHTYGERQSLAGTVAANIAKRGTMQGEVEIYGADTTIRAERTTGGMRFMTLTQGGNRQTAITKYTVRGGDIQSDRVSEIALRKAA